MRERDGETEEQRARVDPVVFRLDHLGAGVGHESTAIEDDFTRQLHAHVGLLEVIEGRELGHRTEAEVDAEADRRRSGLRDQLSVSDLEAVRAIEGTEEVGLGLQLGRVRRIVGVHEPVDLDGVVPLRWRGGLRRFFGDCGERKEGECDQGRCKVLVHCVVPFGFDGRGEAS